MNTAADKLPRLVLTACIVGFFGYALFAHYGNGLEETLKNMTMLAVGYWLGSSKGSQDKTDQLIGGPAPKSAKEGAEQVKDAAISRSDEIGAAQ